MMNTEKIRSIRHVFTLRWINRHICGFRFARNKYEVPYQDLCKESALKSGHIFCWLAALGSAVFSAVELIFYSRHFFDVIQNVRTGVITALFLWGFNLKAYPKFYISNYNFLIPIGLGVYCTSIMALEFLSQTPNHSEFFYLSINSICIFVIFAIYCFSRLPFLHTLLLGGYVLLAACTTIYLSDVFNWVSVARLLTYGVVANGAGMVLRQLLDVRDRRLFLQARRLRNVAALRQQLVVASQKLVKAEMQSNMAKDRFLAILSHEVRTPMHGISVFMRTLQKDLPPDILSKKMKSFKSLERYCSQLLGSFDDMLEYATADESNERRRPSLVTFNLNNLIQDSCMVLHQKAVEKGIELNLVTDETDGTELIGDPNGLVRIVINLVNNAIKFTDLGYVEVRTKIEPNSDFDAVDVEITVSDTGIGIPDTELDNIFSPGYQVDSSYSRKYEGNGLGLSICNKLVKSMSGRLSVSSEVGRGSMFTVNLRLAPATGLRPDIEARAM